MPAELEVMWIFHELITPPGNKMVVCVCRNLGLFININTKGFRRGGIPISQSLHRFLDHDSHLECGKVYEFDDYLI